MGNLRNPPLFLRPSVVRALVDDVHLIARAVSQVPVLPFKLVDQPRPPAPLLVPVSDISEIKRLETAHEPASNDIEHEPAAAQVGRAARKGRERANGSEEGTRARPPVSLLPDLDRKAVAEAYAAGLSLRAVAKQFETSKTTAKSCVLEHGGTLRPLGTRSPAYQPLHVARDAEIAAAFAAGDNVDELAARFELTGSHVRNIANRHGVKRRTGKKIDPAITARNAAIATAYAAGENSAQLMARYRLTRANIYAIANKAGASRPEKVRVPKAAKPPKAVKVRAPKLPRAPKSPRVTKSAATRLSTGDRAGLLTQAPEGTSAGVAGGVLIGRANACEQHDKPVSAAVVRPAAETAPVPAATGTGFYSETAAKQRAQHAGRGRARAEQAADDARKIERRSQRAAEEDAAVSAFQVALARVQARKAESIEVIAPKIVTPLDEGKRVAAAFAARAAVKSTSVPEKAAPTEHAPSREECRICGTPGFKGCDHWLPHLDQPALARTPGPYHHATRAGGDRL